MIVIKGVAPEPTCDCPHCRMHLLADALRLPAAFDRAFRRYARFVTRAKQCRAELEISCPCGDNTCRPEASKEVLTWPAPVVEDDDDEKFIQCPHEAGRATCVGSCNCPCDPCEPARTEVKR